MGHARRPQRTKSCIVHTTVCKLQIVFLGILAILDILRNDGPHDFFNALVRFLVLANQTPPGSEDVPPWHELYIGFKCVDQLCATVETALRISQENSEHASSIRSFQIRLHILCPCLVSAGRERDSQAFPNKVKRYEV